MEIKRLGASEINQATPTTPNEEDAPSQSVAFRGIGEVKDTIEIPEPKTFLEGFTGNVVHENTPVGNPVTSNGGAGWGAFLGEDGPPLDIEELVTWVMQETQRDEDLDLKAAMAEMKTVTETKKDTLEEYEKLPADGTSPTDPTLQFTSSDKSTSSDDVTGEYTADRSRHHRP